jgi:type IV secretory pathway VirB4 component
MNPNQYNQPAGMNGGGIDPSTYGVAPSVPPQITDGSGSKTQLKANAKVLNSTQNMLQIAEIRDGIVIMNDGSYRSIIMVKPINFDLMSGQERESVEYAYQGFLNSLYFPVQIFIHSERIDINPYLERLSKIRQGQDNMLLAMLTDDYINFMGALAQQTNIMDKRFYLVVPYFPMLDMQKAMTQSKNFFTGMAGLFNTKQTHVVVNEGDLGKAKDELKNRVQALLGALLQCGIQGLPLDTQELIELFYNTYNPDTSTRQSMQNFDELNTPIVDKGQGMAPQPNLDREPV